MKKNKNINKLSEVLKTSGLSAFLIFGLNGCSNDDCSNKTFKNNEDKERCYNSNGSSSTYIGSSSSTKHSGFFSNFSSDNHAFGS